MSLTCSAPSPNLLCVWHCALRLCVRYATLTHWKNRIGATCQSGLEEIPKLKKTPSYGFLIECWAVTNCQNSFSRLWPWFKIKCVTLIYMIPVLFIWVEVWGGRDGVSSAAEAGYSTWAAVAPPLKTLNERAVHVPTSAADPLFQPVKTRPNFTLRLLIHCIHKGILPYKIWLLYSFFLPSARMS